MTLDHPQCESRINRLLEGITNGQFAAFHSPEATKELANSWKDLERIMQTTSLSRTDQEIVQVLGHNHYKYSQAIVGLEESLQDICQQAEISAQVFPTSTRYPEKEITDNIPMLHHSTETACPMRTWFYENLLHPFPSISLRRELQRVNGMSMSNINGWFSNMRRRSGWNTNLQELAGGDRVAYKQIIQACFNGSQGNKAIKRKVEDMVDYALGRARGRVGEWLTDVVGPDTLCPQNRMPLTNEIVSPPNHEKRRKIISHREHSVFRHKVEDTPVDLDEEFFELGSNELGVSNELPAMSHGWSTYPHRSFSSSSSGSTISEVSAAVQEEPVFRPFFPPSYYHQSMVEGGQYGLPVSFGGPPLEYSFEPVLNRQDVLRKRTQSQVENLNTSGRTTKVARFS